MSEKIKKYEDKEVQNEKSLLEYYLLKLGEIKFQMAELDRYVNGRGVTVVALALEFQEFNTSIIQLEDKLIQVRKRFLDGNSISIG